MWCLSAPVIVKVFRFVVKLGSVASCSSNEEVEARTPVHFTSYPALTCAIDGTEISGVGSAPLQSTVMVIVVLRATPHALVTRTQYLNVPAVLNSGRAREAFVAPAIGCASLPASPAQHCYVNGAPPAGVTFSVVPVPSASERSPGCEAIVAGTHCVPTVIVATLLRAMP